jgi:hypothetical protein
MLYEYNKNQSSKMIDTSTKTHNQITNQKEIKKKEMDASQTQNTNHRTSTLSKSS